jgi:hypothetical protein
MERRPARPRGANLPAAPAHGAGNPRRLARSRPTPSAPRPRLPRSSARSLSLAVRQASVVARLPAASSAQAATSASGAPVTRPAGETRGRS